jgi:hypothetical protein
MSSSNILRHEGLSKRAFDCGHNFVSRQPQCHVFTEHNPVLERGYNDKKGMKFIKVYYNQDLLAS